MNTITTCGHTLRRCTISTSALALAAVGLLAAPPALGDQTTGGAAVASVSPSPAAADQPGLDATGSVTARQQCKLAVWYTVHNPSINKPRANQDALDSRTPPSGPCPS